MDTTTTRRPAGRGSRTAALAGLGLPAGVAAKAADASGVAWLADLGSRPAAWVLVVALVARSTPSTRRAAVGSAQGVVSAVVALVVALVVAGALPRHHRTRVVALALLVPAAVLATAAVDVLHAVLP